MPGQLHNNNNNLSGTFSCTIFRTFMSAVKYVWYRKNLTFSLDIPHMYIAGQTREDNTGLRLPKEVDCKWPEGNR